MALVLGPKTQAWKCLECGGDFGWNPGVSTLKRPSMCPYCDQKDINKLMRLTPSEMRDGGYS